MPQNQFKCNNDNSTPSDKIDSFNAVYDYYYDNVIRNNKGSTYFEAPTDNNWKTKYCDNDGSCPSNSSAETVTQSGFYTNMGGNINKITNNDLAKYLNDCAGRMGLNKDTSPYYGGIGNDYDKTIKLRDISYNNLLTDRSDLDRKMKEVLALQGAIVNDQQTFVDGSVYTTLLWTVMATSLIYYVFTKI
jgi:hypothetical protein